jgi:hypothetical protein
MILYFYLWEKEKGEWSQRIKNVDYFFTLPKKATLVKKITRFILHRVNK